MLKILRQKRWTRNDRAESPSLTLVSSDESTERPKSSKASENPSRQLSRIQEEDEQSEASSTLPEGENPRTESTGLQRTEVIELEEISESRVVYCERLRKLKKCQVCRKHYTRYRRECPECKLLVASSCYPETCWNDSEGMSKNCYRDRKSSCLRMV